MRYRWCIASNCPHSTKYNPKKLFIQVPEDGDIRSAWLSVSGRNPALLSQKSRLYICEDHFDLEHDMENYMEFKLMGSVGKIRMKPNAIPFKSSCVRSASPGLAEESPPTSVGRGSNLNDQMVSKKDEQSDDEPVQDPLDIKSEQEELSPHCRKAKIAVKNSTTLPTKPCISVATSTVTKITTTNRPGRSTNRSRPIKRKLSVLSEQKSYIEMSISPSPVGATSQDFSPSMDTASGSSFLEHTWRDKKLNLESTMSKIKKNPRLYIGITQELYFLIDIIQQHTNISESNILLCLTKIRLNRSFSELADDFGLSKSEANQIFSTNIATISKVMAPFIKQLSRESVTLNLPAAFRHRYYKVTCIVDCLEIEIQKPKNTVHQALSWSKCNKANTLKYLISYTPDGLISYISPGYGGRVTDITLFEHSKFLDTLPPNK